MDAPGPPADPPVCGPEQASCSEGEGRPSSYHQDPAGTREDNRFLLQLF